MFDGFNDDEEDAFFAPLSSSSSNLESLFGVPMNTSVSAPTVVNTALTYTAPKQPTNTKTEATETKTEDATKTTPKKPKGNSVVIKFKEVQAFKLIKGIQSAQGKCGLALIGNETVHIYQLLLYKQKSDIIATVKVNNKFQFTTLRDNYAIYSDADQENWTVLFNAEVDCDEFTAAIASKGGVIVNNKAVTEQIIPRQAISTETFETGPQAGVNTKADILTRMAKMGQRLLPDNTKSSDEASSENENVKLAQKPRKPRRSVSATSSTTGALALVKTENTSPISMQALALQAQQYVIVNGQVCPVMQSPKFIPEIDSISQAMLPADASTAICSPNQITPDKLNMYFVENRTHNSEVRMNIMRLTTKMEEMMEKVNKIDLSNSSMTEHSVKDSNHKETDTLKIAIKNLETQIADLSIKHETDSHRNEVLSDRITNLLSEIDQHKRVIDKFAKKEKSYVQQIHNLESQIKEKVVKTENYEQDNRNLLTIDTTKMALIDETVKEIMNALYQEVNQQLRDDSAVGKEAKKILAKKIRDSTYYILAAVKELEIVDSQEEI